MIFSICFAVFLAQCHGITAKKILKIDNITQTLNAQERDSQREKRDLQREQRDLQRINELEEEKKQREEHDAELEKEKKQLEEPYFNMFILIICF